VTILEQIRDGWDRAAHEDAIGFICTGRPSEKEFLESGEEDVAALPMPRRRCRALDFGCGIGRLTAALARRFEQVDGLDLSPEMIHRARVKVPDGTVAFHVNPRPDLKLFEDDRFDLVVSLIVLQHVPSDLQRGYVSEFVRVLRPGGLLVFQIPEGQGTEDPTDPLSIYGTPRARVRRWLRSAAATTVTVHEDRYTGSPDFVDWTYVVRASWASTR
jgi:2-polyprenyl-3-methyl-5-hydroxy-6-metoxy-1,4-benzoquinol methylase